MSSKIINYHPDLKQKANNLRQSGVLAEVVMWNKLKAGQILNYRFRRQKPLGPYIVDFYCPKLKLIIEIDGYSHEDKVNYDHTRDKYLKNLSLRVLHFKDKDVLNNIENIITSLEMWVSTNTPNPPLKGGIVKRQARGE